MILRVLVSMLLMLEAATAGSDAGVLAAYKRMEEADRNGDGRLWSELRDRRTLASMSPAVKGSILKGGHARPAVQYVPLSARVDGGSAVLLGKTVDPAAPTTQYQALVFTMEDGAWKVAREQWSDSPFDPFVAYALLPPEDGAFLRAGSPWKRIPYANLNRAVMDRKEQPWNVQGTLDDSFLYVRLEAPAPLPAPGSRVNAKQPDRGKSGIPGKTPALRIKLATGEEFQIAIADVVSMRGAFEGGGSASAARAAASQAFLTYTLTVKNAAGADIFEHSTADDSAARMLTVQDRYVDIAIPVGGLGTGAGTKMQITLEDADTVMRVQPYAVAPWAGISTPPGPSR
jgi:hypothetical protein